MKQKHIIQKMTIEEKAAILSGQNEWQSHGVKRLGIPSVFFSDGPHGMRKQEGAGDHLGLNASIPATCFPAAGTMANSWNEELGEKIGAAIGREAASMGVDVVLGPGLNIKRSPLCGRNFEYFSEDPYLSGKMAASYIRGIQSQGVYACPKHFAVNNQELRRMAMNAVVDERTLREIYLTGFEMAVKEGGAKAIMTGYNQVNGEYANENPHLLKEILRDEWGFEGIVVTDWGGSNDHVRGVKAGSSLEMPNPGFDSARQLIRALGEKRLTLEELDERVDEVVGAAMDLQAKSAVRSSVFDREDHHRLAYLAAAESAVLLKNTEGILPLGKGAKVAVIGDFAVTPRYQGAGSSIVNSTRLDTIAGKLPEYELDVVGVARGYHRHGESDDAMKKEALDLAGRSDVVLFFGGLNEISETEGQDRNHMRIPQNQIDLLEALAQINGNIVAIISAGSAIEMPWQRSCKGILHCYLNGQAGAGAVLDILTGQVNPSGRLSETYPLCYEDTPAFYHYPSSERNAEYREAIYVGYRYYDSNSIQVEYPFGFGLSYTEFSYSNLQVSQEGIEVTITNVGDVDGAEVVQMYVGLANAIVFRPAKELKGFKKIFLKAGESQRVAIAFDDKTFRYWNVKTNRWEMEQGDYNIMVGASIQDIRLRASRRIEGTGNEYPYNPARLPYYYTGTVQAISDREFEELLGHPIPSGKWAGELQMNDAICQMYYAKSRIARLIYQQLTRMKKDSEDRGVPNLNILFLYNMPFRALGKMSKGAVSMGMVDGIMALVNGHFLKGVRKIIVEFFKNARENRAYEKQLKKNK